MVRSCSTNVSRWMVAQLSDQFRQDPRTRFQAVNFGQTVVIVGINVRATNTGASISPGSSVNATALAKVVFNNFLFTLSGSVWGGWDGQGLDISDFTQDNGPFITDQQLKNGLVTFIWDEQGQTPNAPTVFNRIGGNGSLLMLKPATGKIVVNASTFADPEGVDSTDPKVVVKNKIEASAVVSAFIGITKPSIVAGKTVIASTGFATISKEIAGVAVGSPGGQSGGAITIDCDKNTVTVA